MNEGSNGYLTLLKKFTILHKITKEMSTNHNDDDGSERRLKKSLSVLPETPDHILLTFSLTKEEKETWGISIVGGLQSISGHVYVKGITKNSVCALDGQLQIGDNILEINGENLREKTHEEVVEVFRRCQTELNVVVSRLVEQKLRTNSRVLCSYQSSITPKYKGTSLDEESVIMEHKPLPAPKNYSTIIW